MLHVFLHVILFPRGIKKKPINAPLMQNGVLKIKIIEELRGHKVLPVMSHKFDHLLLSGLVWGISLITLHSYIKMIL